MKKTAFFFALAFSVLMTSCVSTKRSATRISRFIYDDGIKSAKQLTSFFMANNPYANRKQISYLAKLYIQEASAEGINSDCAFIQMCHETGFLTFGNLVTEDMNNFCGLGAIDEEHRGEVFQTKQEGVRAHIQHLHAYATKETIQLKNPCIDKRYRYVKPRGKSDTIEGLTGTWAADRSYSQKLERLLMELEDY